MPIQPVAKNAISKTSTWLAVPIWYFRRVITMIVGTPESWIVDITTGSSMAHVSESDFSSVQVAQWNLTNEIKDFDTWWKDYKSSIEKLGAVEYVTELENTVVDQIASKKCEYKLTMNKDTANERTYSYMVICTITKGSAYVFLYTSLEDGDLYKTNMPVIEEILKEFKFN